MPLSPDAMFQASVTLFITIDPLGLVPIFLSLTAGLSARDQRFVATLAVLIALAILAVFTLAGEWILSSLGVGLPAFRVAGGILLFTIAFEMLFDQRQSRKQETAARMTNSEELRTLAAFPLAMPLIAGPGAITACMLLAARTDGDPLALGVLFAIIAATCALTLVLFLLAVPLNRALGVVGRVVLVRFFGIITAALAVQFVADGVQGLIREAGGAG